MEQALAATKWPSAAQKMEAVGDAAEAFARFDNLLTVIAGNAASLAERIAPASESGEDLREIQLAAERATALTRQLLSFGRPKALTHRVFDVNQVIQGLAGLMRRVLGEDVEVELRLDPDLWPVAGDPGQLEQVLVDLRGERARRDAARRHAPASRPCAAACASSAPSASASRTVST